MDNVCIKLRECVVNGIMACNQIYDVCLLSACYHFLFKLFQLDGTIANNYSPGVVFFSLDWKSGNTSLQFLNFPCSSHYQMQSIHPPWHMCVCFVYLTMTLFASLRLRNKAEMLLVDCLAFRYVRTKLDYNKLAALERVDNGKINKLSHIYYS